MASPEAPGPGGGGGGGSGDDGEVMSRAPSPEGPEEEQPGPSDSEEPRVEEPRVEEPRVEEPRVDEAIPTGAPPGEPEPPEAVEAPTAEPEPAEPCVVPTADADSLEAPPGEPPPAEPEPVEAPPAEPPGAGPEVVQTIEAPPAEPPGGEPEAVQTIEAPPAEPPGGEPEAVEAPPAEPPRAEPEAVEAPPAEPPRAEPEPVEAPPAEPPRAEPEPVEPAPTPSVEPDPVGAPPAEPTVTETTAAEPTVTEPTAAETTAAEPTVTEPTVAKPRPVLFEEPAVPLRARLVPGSVLGLTALVLAFAVGAAFSGAILYSYYEFKKDRTEKRVADYVQGFDQRFKDALATIEAESQNARAEIQKELEPLSKTRAEGQTLESLIKKVEPSTFFVSTLDEAGQPSVGSAFAVASDNQQTLLLASYTTVKAVTRQPGPPLTVRKGAEEIRATLWTWHEDRDLALIVLSRGRVPALPFAGQQVRPGERVFALSALGGAGGSVTQGFVADVSAAGIQHDAAVGQAFQGGPLVNSEGAVLAVASRSYAPLGFSSDQVFFAPFVRAACERVLRCDGDVPAMGDQGVPTRR